MGSEMCIRDRGIGPQLFNFPDWCALKWMEIVDASGHERWLHLANGVHIEPLSVGVEPKGLAFYSAAHTLWDKDQSQPPAGWEYPPTRTWGTTGLEPYPKQTESLSVTEAKWAKRILRRWAKAHHFPHRVLTGSLGGWMAVRDGAHTTALVQQTHQAARRLASEERVYWRLVVQGARPSRSPNPLERASTMRRCDVDSKASCILERREKDEDGIR